MNTTTPRITPEARRLLELYQAGRYLRGPQNMVRSSSSQASLGELVAAHLVTVGDGGLARGDVELTETGRAYRFVRAAERIEAGRQARRQAVETTTLTEALEAFKAAAETLAAVAERYPADALANYSPELPSLDELVVCVVGLEISEEVEVS